MKRYTLCPQKILFQTFDFTTFPKEIRKVVCLCIQKCASDTNKNLQCVIYLVFLVLSKREKSSKGHLMPKIIVMGCFFTKKEKVQ